MVGVVQLDWYHSYHCSNQTEPSSALSGALCLHRCLCHSNITIQKDSREIVLAIYYAILMLEHNPEHLLQGQSHAACQALAEHEKQLFYVPPVFIQC